MNRIIYTHKERTLRLYSPADVAATVRRILADRGNAWMSASSEASLAIMSMDRRVSLTTEQLNQRVASLL